MTDSMASLAFSVYSGKGVYAALLGSGVSRSSGIPTGWDITLDFVKKLAILREEEPANLEVWYHEKYGKDPDYSVLLEQLGKEPGDRNLALRPYFEPTEQEREEGKKLPTRAHKAIAALVAKGYIKVIVTTNFDQMMENALRELAVVPDVVSNADQVKGMKPLVHSRCTIIKVHGDYTDTRMKNIASELAGYEPEMDKLLDQVFDEYGLIVCGWSADWDQALRAAIERCPNRRFTTYWSALRDVSGKGQEICTRRAAQIISGMGADEFFGQLQEKVEALEAMDSSRHPLSKQMAVASVKKYISEDRYRTQLHDLFMGEAERAVVSFRGARYAGRTYSGDFKGLAAALTSYEADVDVLLGMMIAGGFWGRDAKLWIRCLERVAEPSEAVSYEDLLANLAAYPVRLLLYGCGVAAIASNQDEIAGELLAQSRTLQHGRTIHLWQRLGNENQINLLDTAISQGLHGGARSHFPVSQHIYNKLLPEFRSHISGEREFRAAFNRFEYFAGLIYGDKDRETNSNNQYIWGPAGLFALHGFTAFADAFQKEIELHGANLPILKSGAFQGSIERLRSVKSAFDNDAKGFARAHGFRST